MSTKIPRPFLTAGVVLCASLFIFSCQTGIEPIPPVRQALEPITPDLLFQNLAHRQSGVHSLKSFVRTSVQGPDRKNSFKQMLIVEGESAIRLDTHGLFGQALGVFIHNDRETVIYDVESGRMIRGPEVWKALGKILGVTVDFTRYIGIFSGNIPRFENLRLVDAPLSPDGTSYQLTSIEQATGAQVDIEINALTLLPVKMIRHISGRNSIEVHWEDYRKIGGRDFPHQIEIVLPGDQKISMRYKEPILNTRIATDAFDLSAYEKASSR